MSCENELRTSQSDASALSQLIEENSHLKHRLKEVEEFCSALRERCDILEAKVLKMELTLLKDK
ncbi:hypothetical protein Scep_013829 [Stephania cephalantha]|uniref:Uncharacterized protein n=1 Tax=Stephania cephalantha TaxID=152367 RepID=A0AAP0J1Y9_9MAGN